MSNRNEENQFKKKYLTFYKTVYGNVFERHALLMKEMGQSKILKMETAC